ncbi:MAG: phosphatase PAP2 family protein [Deltaproteobacteria bacterium]|nr:phosphatase PAP2 family protein [Deltaproteobacteria bacterium]
MRALFGSAALAAALLHAEASEACEPRLAPLPGHGTPTPFDRIGCNVVDAFTGENLLFYTAAILTTMELSASGADHDIRVAFEEHLQSRPFGDAMVALGYVGPPAFAALLYGTGLVTRRSALAGAGAASLQAMTVTFATVVLAKGLTGRPFPNHGGDPTSPSRLEHPEWAREWNGPRLEFTAFPSGHAAVATALASSLTAYAVDAPWVGFATYPVAAAISFGLLSGAHHWASDVVAGALLGQAVGWSIGTDFRRMQDARTTARLRVVPFGAGVALTGAL